MFAQPSYQLLNIEEMIKNFNDSTNKTARIKTVGFDLVNEKELQQALLFAIKALENSSTPGLFQHRQILKPKQALFLNEWLKEASSQSIIKGGVNAVVGIPGSAENLYYITFEHPGRLGHNGTSITHNETIRRGLEMRTIRSLEWYKNLKIELQNQGILIYALDFTSSQNGIEIFSGRDSPINLNKASEQLASLFQYGFEYSHDPAQQTISGQENILNSNPVLVAVHDGIIVAAGVIEQDPRFNFNNWSLSEPTFVTLPDQRFRSKGISSLLRNEMLRLINHPLYLKNHGQGIIFCESIRGSSGKLSVANNYLIGEDLDILGCNGDLAPQTGAYTYIGSANPQTGLAPMILTYITTETKYDREN